MRRHHERHFGDRISWLRAAVLGANDGIISTASLIAGVAAANVGRPEVLIAGLAGLVAGSASMAAGEFVSVSAQADLEKADLERERREIETDPEFETQELADIYRERGLDAELAREVAVQLMEHDALGAHARDELGMTDIATAQPLQAAAASAASFAAGAMIPLGAAAATRAPSLVLVIAISLVALCFTGAVSARAGGAAALRGALRVTVWGAVAMALTASIGSLIG